MWGPTFLFTREMGYVGVCLSPHEGEGYVGVSLSPHEGEGLPFLLPSPAGGRGVGGEGGKPKHYNPSSIRILSKTASVSPNTSLFQNLNTRNPCSLNH